MDEALMTYVSARLQALCLPLVACTLCVMSGSASAAIDAEGDILLLDDSGKAVSSSAGDQLWARAAWNGEAYLVVWQDARSAVDNDIYAARVDASGLVVDPEGIAISASAGNQERPDVVWNGTGWLVVWHDFRAGETADIYAARVDTNGSLIDADGIVVSNAEFSQMHPRVSWNGTNHFVVWDDGRNGVDSDILGARVELNGSVLDASGITISKEANNQATPAVSWGGTNFLVVWADFRGGSGTSSDIFGARVNSSGALQDNRGVSISGSSDNQSTPDVVWNGTSWMVVWEDFRPANSSDVYGARVATNANVQDSSGIAINTASGQQSAPSVQWDGANHFVTWTDGTAIDVYGARITADAQVIEPEGLLLYGGARGTSQSGASAAWNGDNFVVFWSGNDTNEQFDIYAGRVSTLATADLDDDGVYDSVDNCPETENAGQEDIDLDTVGDACDCDPENVEEPGEDGECPSGCGSLQVMNNSRNTLFGLFLMVGPLAFFRARRRSR